MHDIIMFISELKELQELYNSGDLRNYDFERLIQKYQEEADKYDADMSRLMNNFYRPQHEV